ncbi:unnamed protein product [Musa acuminata var. zebrina]
MAPSLFPFTYIMNPRSQPNPHTASSYPTPTTTTFITTMAMRFLLVACSLAAIASAGNFYQEFDVTWGDDRAKNLDNGQLLTLSLDKASGSGFQSKNQYLFGKIDMQIKLVPGNSAGTVTAYYLSSQGPTHDEIDFEFLGNLSGDPYTLHTNVFTQGKGNREMQFKLWFDPTEDFHTYSILWNPRHVIFMVDGTPIRDFKNLESRGIAFPNSQPMRIYSSLWNADDWATRGGLVKTDWSKAPFTASYRNFKADTCVPSSATSECASNSVPSNGGWWNQELDSMGQQRMKWVQKNYMIYNYCSDLKRFPQGLPPEVRRSAAPMDAPLSGADIAKRLASCNKAARDRAVRVLSSWLCRQSDDAVSDADLAKIWKGIFYCVWHADKLPVQADLAGRLATLLESVSAPLAARYFEAFLLTIRREWSGIDFLRLDKFYLLIRRFLCHAFLLLRKNAWDPELTARLTGILLEKSLLSADNYPANGVNYHVAEVFLDEIRDLLPLAVETLDLMLNPFVSVLKKSADKVLVNKIKINVFDRLLENGRKLLNLEKAGDKVDSGNEVEKLGKVALLLAFSKKFFDSASASETLQGNRKILFLLHEDFLKLENDLDKSGIHISVQHLDNGSSENVSSTVVTEMQVEVKNGCGDGGSDDKRNKKRKSLKKSSDSIKKKKKKSGKKKSSMDSVMGSDVVEATTEGIDVVDDVSSNGDVMETHGLTDFDECMISNLQRQFEKAAAEAGMTDDNDQFSVMPARPVAGAALKRMRRAKSADVKLNDKRSSANGEGNVEKSGDKSAKKVRFSMKSNLVWKPNNPLPPHSLRLPPSVTPKGSALKQGVPPGPIRETPPTIKKIKVKASSVKKSRKGVKSPAIKRLRKLQSLLV